MQALVTVNASHCNTKPSLSQKNTAIKIYTFQYK